MLGAIIGDIIGSQYEFDNIKTKEFRLFTDMCRFTDDSVMTIAVGMALLNCHGDYQNLSNEAIKSMQLIGRKYPKCGYGGNFRRWIQIENPKPYNSYGNGAPMRVSPCGIVGKTLEEVKYLSRVVTEVSHNHPEALKAAEAVAVSVFMARQGKSKKEIFDYVNEHYYVIDFTLDEIRDEYQFDVSSQGSTPQALAAFFESTSFEDAIRNAVSIGGDSDTIAAITGSIAAEYYGIPNNIIAEANFFLDSYLKQYILNFTNVHLVKIKH